MRLDSTLCVAVRSSDALSALALRTLLEAQGLRVLPGEGAEATVILLDLKDASLDRLAAETRPIMGLYQREEEALRAAEQGVTSLLDRGTAPERLALGLRALHGGLWVMEPELRELLLERQALELEQEELSMLLSDREREVLSLAAAGMSNKEISAALFVTVHTVKFHLQAILKKLGVRSRTEAAVVAARAGLI